MHDTVNVLNATKLCTLKWLIVRISVQLKKSYFVGACLVTSVMSNSLRPPWTVTRQAPLPMGFSRQEYWSGLPFLFPRDLSDPGIEPRSPTLQADSSPAEPPGKPVDINPSVKRSLAEPNMSSECF